MLKRDYEGVLVLDKESSVPDSPYFELRRKTANVAREPEPSRSAQ